MTSYPEIVTSLSFFLLMANLQPPGSRITEARFLKLTFSLTIITIIFYLTNLKTELKNLSDSNHTIALNKGTILVKKNPDYFCKKKLTLAKLRRFWY